MNCPNCKSSKVQTLQEGKKKCATCDTIFEGQKIIKEGKELLIEVNPNSHVF